MPILSKSIQSIKPHSGRYRVRFLYVLEDGREVHRGPLFVPTQADADTKLIDLEPAVLASVQKHDAKDATTLDIQVAYKEATQAQVQYAWLKDGFDSDEPYKAYNKMKDIGPALLSLGLTDEQYAVALNCPVEEVVSAIELWTELESDKTVIAAYGSIR